MSATTLGCQVGWHDVKCDKYYNFASWDGSVRRDASILGVMVACHLQR